MSFRKETKFRLSESDQLRIKNDLILDGMKVLYPSRKINSTYFDTNDLSMFWDSEEGVLPRKKVRVRWYENDMQLTKEVKISSIEGRFKYTKKVKAEIFNSFIKRDFQDKDYGLLNPVILISYSREYYKYKGLRLTFDSDIDYRGLGIMNSLQSKDSERVLEIKTPFETGDDYILSKINHPTSRFSKYSRGLLKLQNLL